MAHSNGLPPERELFSPDHSQKPAVLTEPTASSSRPQAGGPTQRSSGGAFLWFLLILLLAAGGAAAWFFLKPAAPPPVAVSPPPPPTVSVAAVLARSVTEWDEFSGRIRAIDRVEVRPRVSGMIDSVNFAEGQLVRQGDLLFNIDPRPFEAQLAQSKAEQASAQAQLALAKTQLERGNRLIQDKVIAQDELDQQNASLLEAEAKLESSAAAVKIAELNLEYTRITAPVSGRVSRAEITSGNLVGAGVTAPILTTIVSVSPVYVEFDIDEATFIRYAANGAAGNTGIEKIPVEMGLASEEGYPHKGQIKSLDNQLDTTSGTVRVRAIFENPNGTFAPGLFARVRTGGSSAETTLLIDDKAVGTDQNKKFVLVVDANNKAAYREIRIGPLSDGLRIVRSGLQSGERIVTSGLQRVRPNSLVTPKEVPMEAPDLPPVSK